MTTTSAGAELPAWLADRYRSQRHLAALVEIGRILDAVGMTWRSLHRATAEPPKPKATGTEYAPAEILTVVDRLERVRPWPKTSTAPEYMATLRELAGKYDRVILSARQTEWLSMLLARCEEQPKTERDANVITPAQWRRAAVG
jgi:hypothetical protein